MVTYWSMYEDVRIGPGWIRKAVHFAIVSFQRLIATVIACFACAATPTTPAQTNLPERVQAQDLLFALTLVNVYSAIIFLYNSRVLFYICFFFCMYQEHRQTQEHSWPLLENITRDYDLEPSGKLRPCSRGSGMQQTCHTSAIPLKPHPLASSHQIVNKDNSHLRLGLGTVHIWTGTVSVPEIRYRYPTVSIFYEWTPPSCLRFSRKPYECKHT